MMWPWRRRNASSDRRIVQPPGEAGVECDDLLRRALALVLDEAGRVPAARVVEGVTSRLVAEDFPRNGWLDGGVWAWSIYRGTTTAAVRVHHVSLMGDETS